MRLPPRHGPPGSDAPQRRCAHLEHLAAAATGLPLAPAVDALGCATSRGRFGNALQWHFGLEPHDGAPELDWEGRIELKLVSVWRRRDGSIACDKLKVCDAAIDPAHKLSNVLWVFVDRLTRVVVGHQFSRLAGAIRERLSAGWNVDPHFGRPELFIETRESDRHSAPAYYLASHWFAREGVLPVGAPGVLAFDARWWSQARKAHGGRDPLLVVAPPGATRVACPRCRGPIELDADRVAANGWAPARHAMPVQGACALTAHASVDPAALPGPACCSADELVAGVQRAVAADRMWRLADRVAEPDDHLH